MKKFLMGILLISLISCQKNLPPIISISLPASNSVFIQGEIVSISVNTEDPDGSVEEVWITLNDIESVLLESAPYTIELETKSLEPGSHTIKASAIDNENMEATEEVDFFVTEKERNKKSSFEGLVQKGPYINGTDINIYGLDAELKRTGDNFETQTSDNTGKFALNSIEVESEYFELRAGGYYYDEIQGAISADGLALYAITDLRDSISVNINVLTHMEKSRVEYLINSGYTFDNAKATAQKEILSIFHLNMEEMSPSELLDVSKADEEHAILLAISLILQSGRTVSELSILMANIIVDTREDGILDNQSIRTSLFDNARFIDTMGVKSNLQMRYELLEEDVEISSFGKYIDLFLQKQSS